MFKLALVLVMALLVGQPAVLAFASDDECCQACPEDEAIQDCSPQCTSCPSCAPHSFIADMPVLDTRPARAARLSAWVVVYRSSLHSREIFHVPIPARS
jgi:hypothetical protein